MTISPPETMKTKRILISGIFAAMAVLYIRSIASKSLV